MSRNPDTCPFRVSLPDEEANDDARCAVVERMIGAANPAYSRVPRATCEACCRSVQPGENLNPVVASVIYTAAGMILESSATSASDREKARVLRTRIMAHLAIVPPALPDRIFPPEAVSPLGHSSGAQSAGRPGDRLEVGVLTAPRRVPMLAATLRSLESAGFERLHIFAEPGSAIPPEANGHRVETQPRRLGNFVNFYRALATLYRQNDRADGVLIFQDDIEVAAGLKGWCDAELFPHDCGLVSLFTPRMHTDIRPGWRVLSPGAAQNLGRSSAGPSPGLARAVLERPPGRPRSQRPDG